MSLLSLEKEYKGLLAPIKNAEQSFDVPVANSIHDFLLKFCQGNLNFNSAAIILQAGTSVYGKKVECLYTLFLKFIDQLSHKQKKGESQEKKTSAPKEREKKEKNNDLFLSTEIKLGKNLSCLAKKNSLKNSKKKELQKPEKTFSLPPAYLLQMDDENKGDIFYDVRGSAVGYRGDYVLNKCKLTTSGWLLLPCTSTDFIPNSLADYTIMDSSIDANENVCNNNDPITDTPSTQDEGIGSAPMSMGTDSVGCTPNVDLQSEAGGSEINGNPISEPCTDADDIPCTDADDIPCTDEGIGLDEMPEGPNVDNGLQPLGENVPAVEEIENIPVNDFDGTDDPAPNPIRPSVRKALDECQLDEQNSQKTPESFVRKAIQKKNTICLPAKLKQSNPDNEATEPLSAFCSRAFYAIEDKVPNSNSKFCLEMYCLKQNADIHTKFEELLEIYKQAMGKKKNTADDAADEVVDEEQVDVKKDDVEEEDSAACPSFDDCDVQIDNNPDVLNTTDENPLTDDFMEVSTDPASVDTMELMKECFEDYKKSSAEYDVKSDLTAKIQAWEENILPFLDEQDRKPAFDINSYGSFILNSFEDTDRKQTKTFKDICKGKPKWQVHRYFMALLPLANIGNVSLEAEPHQDGTEDINVTLLSRKMHHKELEKFGHSDGSHD